MEKTATIKLKADMSPQAIDRRLREVSQLRALCLSLQKAKHLGKYTEVKPLEETDVNKSTLA